MLTLRRADDRGRADLGWLDSRHTFSFSDYYDPRHMGFRSLRVINDDRVAPGRGFGTHPHRDMEIVSYVLDGALEHKDSMGNGSVIVPGDVQRMSAGTGVFHSEFNPSAKDGVRFLQIWIQPKQNGGAPGYEQKRFSPEDKRGRLRLVASPDGAEGSVRIGQDARLYASILASGHSLEHTVAEGRHVWLQVARGSLTVNGQTLNEGDGASTSTAGRLALSGPAAGHADGETEFLLFDLA